MTQEAVQITTTPPLPGLQLVQDLNKALQTLATDFSGTTDPAAMAWAYSTWADTSTGTMKRRNATNSAWVIEGRLLCAHLPMYAQADVPTADIGPIYIIGKGPAEWSGAAYKPLISGIPGATFAEVDALTADQGPIICTDMGGAVYVWDVGSSTYAPLIADEIYAGSMRRATTAEAQALTDDTRALTPKKLADAFGGSNQSLFSNGYQKLPGGLIIQWGSVEIAARMGEFDFGIQTFPVSFGGGTLCANATIVTTDAAANADNFAVVKDVSNTGLRVMSGTTLNQTRNFGVFWFAIGF